VSLANCRRARRTETGPAMLQRLPVSFDSLAAVVRWNAGSHTETQPLRRALEPPERIVLGTAFGNAVQAVAEMCEAAGIGGGGGGLGEVGGVDQSMCCCERLPDDAGGFARCCLGVGLAPVVCRSLVARVNTASNMLRMLRGYVLSSHEAGDDQCALTSGGGARRAARGD